MSSVPEISLDTLVSQKRQSEKNKKEKSGPKKPFSKTGNRGGPFNKRGGNFNNKNNNDNINNRRNGGGRLNNNNNNGNNFNNNNNNRNGRNFNNNNNSLNNRRPVGNGRFVRRTGGGQQFRNRERVNSFNNRRDSPPTSRRESRDFVEREPIQIQRDLGNVMEIHNLSPQILEEELYNLVTRYGAVEECRIERDSKGRSMEKATVVFRDKLSYEEAKKELHRCELEGRTISIEITRRTSPTSDRERAPRREVQREPIARRNGYKSNVESRADGPWQRNGSGGRRDRF